MRPTPFDDRTVTLEGAPEQLAALGAVLSSRTRLAVLSTLVHSAEPLHINEIARRVGVDASPVRTHLELLVKAGLVTEVTADVGRERRFRTLLKDISVTLEGVNRVAAPEKRKEPSKHVIRIQKRLAGVEADRQKMEAFVRRLQAELAAAWEEAD
jgi:DNA-binding transcriptional ArsR family regulator